MEQYIKTMEIISDIYSEIPLGTLGNFYNTKSKFETIYETTIKQTKEKIELIYEGIYVCH